MLKMRTICLLLLALVVATGSLSAQVYINEFNGDPSGTPGTDANLDTILSSSQDEFVEIVNAGAGTVDISGWTIADAAFVRHTFAQGTMLAPGAGIVVFGGGNLTTFNALGVATGVAASTGSVGLNNGGDTITLADSMAVVIDQVIYSPAGNGESLTRTTDLPTDMFSLHFTDLATLIGHSAGYRVDGVTGWLPAILAPPAPPSQVYINEYCNDPYNNGLGIGIDSNADGVPATSSSQGNDEFIEIVNMGPTTIDITNWQVTFNGTLRHTFAGGTMLPAGAAIVVFSGGDVTNFNTLGAATGVLASGGFLGFSNSGGNIELLDDMAMLVNGVTYTSGSNQDGDGESVTRVTDTSGDALDLHTNVTPGLNHSAGFKVDGTTPFLPAMLPLPVWPGNATDFRVETSINAVVQTSPTNVFPAADFNGINLFFHSPGGTTEIRPFSCFFQIVPTGTFLPVASVPGETGGFWLDQTGTYQLFSLLDGMGLGNGNVPLAFAPLLPLGGMNYTFAMPAGLTGFSLMIQSLILEPGLNVINFGIDDAIELQIM